MEATRSTTTARENAFNRLWRKIRARKTRVYYWPIRTAVQLGFFLLFAGVALMRLNPSFDGARTWVNLPVLASVKAQGTIWSSLDATTLLLSKAMFPWLPVATMFVVG